MYLSCLRAYAAGRGSDSQSNKAPAAFDDLATKRGKSPTHQ